MSETLEWLTEVIPPEILMEIAIYCSPELSRVNKWFNTLIYEATGIILKHPLLWNKRFTNKHSSLQNVKLLNPLAKLTILEWSIVKENRKLITLILSDPRTKMTFNKSRCIKIAIHHGNVDIIKLLATHDTFNNAVSSGSKSEIQRLVNCSPSKELFDFFYSIKSFRPTKECIHQVLYGLNRHSKQHTIELIKHKLETILKHPKPIFSQYDVHRYYNSEEIPMDMLINLIADKRFEISDGGNWILRTCAKHPMYQQCVKSIITHPKFVANTSAYNANDDNSVYRLIIRSNVDEQIKFNVLQTVPRDTLLTYIASSPIDIMPFWKAHFEYMFDFVTTADLIQQMTGGKLDVQAMLFWLNQGKSFTDNMALRVLTLASQDTSMNEENLQTFIQFFDHPSVNLFPVMSSLIIQGSMIYDTPTILRIPDKLLSHLMSHPKVSKDVIRRIICGLIAYNGTYACYSQPYIHSSTQVLQNLMNTGILDPSANNFFYLLYCLDKGHYAHFMCMRTHPNVKLAEMQKVLIYDEYQQTLSLKVASIVNPTQKIAETQTERNTQ